MTNLPDENLTRSEPVPPSMMYSVPVMEGARRSHKRDKVGDFFGFGWATSEVEFRGRQVRWDPERTWTPFSATPSSAMIPCPEPRGWQ